MHAFPFSVISEGSFYRARFDPQNRVGVIGLTGRIQKDKARRVDTADTVCVQEYHFVHPWSVRWQPIRFERMTNVLITDCVHTPGDCTRTSPR